MSDGGDGQAINPSILYAEQQTLNDERKRLEHTRAVEERHEPGRGPVDLDSGRILITPEQEPAVLPPRPRLEESEESEEPEET